MYSGPMMNYDETLLVPQTHFTDEWDRGNGFAIEAEGHNLIVAGMRLLLAALLGNQFGYAGMQYWGVGRGPATDNPLSPTPPTTSDTKLADEIARVPVTVGYVDDFGKPTSGGAVSRNLQIQAIFGPNVATGNHTEFGLFGGQATGTINTGMLLNRVTHPVKVMQASDTRRLTIVFSF